MTEPLRPWLPPSLARQGFTAETVTTLSYVLLDEIVVGIVTFLVHPWPGADPLGRVRFGRRDDQVTLTARLAEVRRQLYRRFRQREPRPGDLFASRLRPGVAGELDESGAVDDLAAVFDGAVYDLSAEGRVLAKLAYYGSVSAVIPAPKLEQWGVAVPEQDPTTPAPVREL